MLISKLNDKFYKTYKILFNKQINKFYVINNYILYIKLRFHCVLHKIEILFHYKEKTTPNKQTNEPVNN